MTYTRTAGLLLLVVGCGGPVASDLPRCLQLSQPGGDGVTVTAPAKVSAFFSVATCAGEPLSQLAAANFEILEDGAAVSPYESRRTVQPKGQRYQMDSLMLLDFSGSILRSGSWPALREAAGKYVETVLARVGDGQRVAIYTFDGRATPQQVVAFTSDKQLLLGGLDGLGQTQCTHSADCATNSEAKTCAAFRCVDDSTNLNGAIVSALSTLEAQTAAQKDIAFKDAALVVFTDGTDQAARVTEGAARQRANNSSAHVFTIGLGAESDANALRALGKDGFYPASEPMQLSASFTRIAESISGLANRFYLLEYCSPKRGGRHELKLVARWTAKDGTPLVGSLTREFDASGFESGCDLVGQ
jgi:hypothetical protein